MPGRYNPFSSKHVSTRIPRATDSWPLVRINQHPWNKCFVRCECLIRCDIYVPKRAVLIYKPRSKFRESPVRLIVRVRLFWRYRFGHVESICKARKRHRLQIQIAVAWLRIRGVSRLMLCAALMFCTTCSTKHHPLKSMGDNRRLWHFFLNSAHSAWKGWFFTNYTVGSDLQVVRIWPHYIVLKNIKERRNNNDIGRNISGLNSETSFLTINVNAIGHIQICFLCFAVH